MRSLTYRNLFKQKQYRLLFSSNIVNRFGDAIDTLAFSWLVYSFTGKSMWAAIIFAVNKIPSIFLLPLAGAIVEKYEKKRVILICDFFRCVLVTGLICIILVKKLSLPVLFLFTFLISIAEAFRMPASNAFITQLLDKDLLDRGIVLNVIASTFSEIVGTAIGGYIINKYGVNLALLTDVVSFVISISLIFFIHHKEEIAIEIKKSNSFQIFKDGLLYIKNRSAIIHIIFLAALANAVMSPLDSLQTAMVVEVFHRKADFLSVLNIALSIGMFVGGVMYPTIRTYIKDKNLYLSSFLYIGALYLFISVFGQCEISEYAFQYIMMVAYFLYGLAASFLATGLGLQLVESTEQLYLARTTTIYSAIASMATPMASTIAGLLTNWMNIQCLFSICSIIIIIGTALYLIAKRKM